MNSQNSMENSGFIGTSQMFEYDNNKPNSMAKSLDKKIQDDMEGFNVNNTLNQSISFETENDSSFMDSSYILPIYILCPSCDEYFDLKSINLQYINIECRCRCINNCPLTEFKKKQDNDHFFYTQDKLQFGCKLHSNQKYIKYCKDCKQDLCKICLEESAKYNNDSGKHTPHETHELVDLLNIDKKIIKVRNLIEALNFEKIKAKDPNKNNNIENDEEPDIKKLILGLLNYYYDRPSYNGYKAIKVAKAFLSHPFKQKIKPNLKYEELFKITSIKELKEKINYPHLIYKIIINGDETKEELENLNIFKNKKFSKLEVIQINNIKKLNNIEALTSCLFPELKELVIGCTELNNECINVIKKLKLPKIKFISFFGNKITSPEIFGAVEKFNTLEKYYIGSNQIDINKLPNKKIKYNFPKNLIELGISKMFTKNTNSFITEHLNLKNIKMLYISGNEIVSLKAFEKIKFNHLEEFWVRGKEKGECLESIEEVEYLKHIKSLKKIVVKQNSIKDIEKLVDIISPFKNLELFNIEDNGIDKEKMEFIIKKIKKKGKFKKLKFKYN